MVLLCPAVAAVAAYAYGSSLEPTYRATGQIALEVTPHGVSEGLDSRSLAGSWTSGIPEVPNFWYRASYRLHGAAPQASLVRAVQFRHLFNTNVILVTAEGQSPEKAALFLRAAVREFEAVVRRWRGRPATASDLGAISRPASPVDPNLSANTLAGAAIGLTLGVGWFLLQGGGASATGGGALVGGFLARRTRARRRRVRERSLGAWPTRLAALLVLALAAVLGLVSARASDQTRPVLWALVLAVVLAAPLIHDIRTRTFELFAPLWPILFGLAVHFVAQTLYLAYVSNYQIGLLPIERWTYLINVALVLCIFGVLAFYVGYYRCGRISDGLARLIPRPRYALEPRRVALAVVALTLISLLSYGLIMKSPSGVIQFIKHLHSHNQAFRGRYEIYYGAQMCIVAALLWLAMRPRGRRWVIAYSAYLGFTFLLILSLGGRALAGTVIETAIIVYHYRVRFVRVRTVLSVAAALLVIALFVGAYRNYSDSASSGRSIGERLAAVASPRGFLDQWLQYDVSSLDTFVLLLDKMPRQIHPVYGETFAGLAWTFAPRAIWHGKPQQFDTQVAQKLFGPHTTGKAGSIVSEGFYNFLWPGVLAVMLVFGIVARAVYSYLRLGPRSVGAIVLYALLWKWLWTVNAGGASEATLGMVMLVVPALVAVRFARVRPGDSARS